MCGVWSFGVRFLVSKQSSDDATVQRYAFSYANILQEENVL